MEIFEIGSKGVPIFLKSVLASAYAEDLVLLTR